MVIRVMVQIAVKLLVRMIVVRLEEVGRADCGQDGVGYG